MDKKTLTSKWQERAFYYGTQPEPSKDNEDEWFFYHFYRSNYPEYFKKGKDAI